MNFQIASTVVLGFLAACNGSNAGSATADSADTADNQEVVQFRFEPTPDQRQQLAEAIPVLKERLGLPHMAVSVDRFGTAPERFFLFIIPPPEHSGGNVLFAVANRGAAGSVQVSGVHDTGVQFGPTGVSVKRIEDIDADGLPDVLYCVAASEGQSAVSRAAGFANGSWYEIENNPALQKLECGSAGQ